MLDVETVEGTSFRGIADEDLTITALTRLAPGQTNARAISTGRHGPLRRPSRGMPTPPTCSRSPTRSRAPSGPDPHRRSTAPESVRRPTPSPRTLSHGRATDAREGRRSGQARVPTRGCVADAASAHRSAPVETAIQVAASISTTLGGVPRVCRGPWMTCTAPNGGTTRTSTLLPGAFSSEAAAAGSARRWRGRCAAASHPRPPRRGRHREPRRPSTMSIFLAISPDYDRPCETSSKLGRMSMHPQGARAELLAAVADHSWECASPHSPTRKRPRCGPCSSCSGVLDRIPASTTGPPSRVTSTCCCSGAAPTLLTSRTGLLSRWPRGPGRCRCRRDGLCARPRRRPGSIRPASRSLATLP